jgi:hypothetical protein
MFKHRRSAVTGAALALLATAAIGGTAVASGGSERATAPSGTTVALELVGTLDTSTTIDVGRHGPSVGDSTVFKESVNEPGEPAVGSDRGICWRHVGGDLCEIFFQVGERGTIEVAGFMPRGADPTELTITGGTLEFDAVGGRVLVEPGDHPRYTFHFS